MSALDVPTAEEIGADWREADAAWRGDIEAGAQGVLAMVRRADDDAPPWEETTEEQRDFMRNISWLVLRAALASRHEKSVLRGD